MGEGEVYPNGKNGPGQTKVTDAHNESLMLSSRNSECGERERHKNNCDSYVSAHRHVSKGGEER